MWAGIARYLHLRGLRWLGGCASVPVADGGLAAAEVWAQARAKHLAPEPLRVRPLRPWFAEPGVPTETIAGSARLVPPLLRGYLRLGAQVCGEPAYDPDFGVADFYVLLSMDRINPRYLRHFLGGNREPAVAAQLRLWSGLSAGPGEAPAIPVFRNWAVPPACSACSGSASGWRPCFRATDPGASGRATRLGPHHGPRLRSTPRSARSAARRRSCWSPTTSPGGTSWRCSRSRRPGSRRCGRAARSRSSRRAPPGAAARRPAVRRRVSGRRCSRPRSTPGRPSCHCGSATGAE